nr:hypothetical protein Iba_chr09aCG12400 [Ipomoea batatas]
MISLCWQSTSSVTTNYAMADIIVSVCVGRHCVFSTQSNPSSSFEKNPVHFSNNALKAAPVFQKSVPVSLTPSVEYFLGATVRGGSVKNLTFPSSRRKDDQRGEDQAYHLQFTKTLAISTLIYVRDTTNKHNSQWGQLKASPSICHGTLQRAQWTTSNTLLGKGSLFVPITAEKAGIPLSSANCTCASCSSFGASDIASTSLSKSIEKRYSFIEESMQCIPLSSRKLHQTTLELERTNILDKINIVESSILELSTTTWKSKIVTSNFDPVLMPFDLGKLGVRLSSLSVPDLSSEASSCLVSALSSSSCFEFSSLPSVRSELTVSSPVLSSDSFIFV